MTDLTDLSLVDLSNQLVKREVSAREVVEACFERIRVCEPRLNCFVRLDEEEALAAADGVDDALAKGQLRGLLHGVPMAHKDMFYRRGKVSTCGSRIFKDSPATSTSTLLKRLDAAGSIDLGTLNMTEFAFGPTGHNAVLGDCHNPWDLECIPGGSSSGSGTAVAARLVFGSLGSDSGGSVRLPAAICGVVGLKPTLGLLSLYGAMGLSYSIDTAGVLARTARDCARVMNVIAGHDPNDIRCTTRSVPDYEGSLDRDIRSVRIGVPTSYFYDHCGGAIRERLEQSLQVFETLGAEIVDVRIPETGQLMELSRAVLYPECTALHAADLRERMNDYSPQIRVRAATGFGIPAPVYLSALHARPGILKRFVDSVFDACDVLHTPLLSISVPKLSDTDVGIEQCMWETIGLLCHSTAPFNYLGLPAMSVPAGFDESGLPVSLQLVGRPFSEAGLLRVAAAYQNETRWHLQSPKDI